MGLRERSYAVSDGMEWYAIYTKPRWEKKVFAALQSQGIIAYCPMNRVVRQWSDRKKTVELPLFSSYVFVQIAATGQDQVRRTPGVVNFVYWLGRLAVIRNSEMVALQDFVDKHKEIHLEALDYVKGDTVEIDAGPLKGQKGIIQKVGKNRLELVLEQLNVKLIVPIKSQTERK
jgi:transcription antitermination factor NusG